jgi:hypothetical protein
MKHPAAVYAGTREAGITYLTLLPIAGGVVIASGGEPLFHLLGFVACLLATSGRALKSVVQVSSGRPQHSNSGAADAQQRQTWLGGVSKETAMMQMGPGTTVAAAGCGVCQAACSNQQAKFGLHGSGFFPQRKCCCVGTNLSLCCCLVCVCLQAMLLSDSSEKLDPMSLLFYMSSFSVLLLLPMTLLLEPGSFAQVCYTVCWQTPKQQLRRCLHCLLCMSVSAPGQQATAAVTRFAAHLLSADA